MKYHNPFLFLCCVIAMFFLAAWSRAADPAQDVHTRVALALAAASRPLEPPLPKKPQVCQCANGDICICGEGKCSCVGGKSLKDPEYVEFLAWKAKQGKAPKRVEGETVDGWTWTTHNGGYWYQYPPTPAPVAQAAPMQFAQPMFAPMMGGGGFGGFGGGGFGGGMMGGGGGGGCSGGG